MGLQGGGEDAKWIVIRTSLWGHNDTTFERSTPGRHIGRPGVGRPVGVFRVFSDYQLVILIFNIVPLISELDGNFKDSLKSPKMHAR
jgi:hypothetical protein